MDGRACGRAEATNYVGKRPASIRPRPRLSLESALLTKVRWFFDGHCHLSPPHPMPLSTAFNVSHPCSFLVTMPHVLSRPLLYPYCLMIYQHTTLPPTSHTSSPITHPPSHFHTTHTHILQHQHQHPNPPLSPLHTHTLPHKHLTTPTPPPPPSPILKMSITPPRRPPPNLEHHNPTPPANPAHPRPHQPAHRSATPALPALLRPHDPRPGHGRGPGVWRGAGREDPFGFGGGEAEFVSCLFGGGGGGGGKGW